jgi:hypothetical protein
VAGAKKSLKKAVSKTTARSKRPAGKTRISPAAVKAVKSVKAVKRGARKTGKRR